MTDVRDRPDLEGPPPQHVAFIMDGNGRWATRQGLDRTEGHRRGVETVRNVLSTCRDWGIRYASLYAFSTENWKRPRAEVDLLFDLLAEYLERELDAFHRDQVRLRFLGDLERLPPRARTWVERVASATAGHDRWHVQIAVNYGGRDEILRAVRRYVADPRRGEAAALDEATFGGYLDTAGVPDPDVMIRTSGEERISNFLLWQLAYAELVFVPELWPDFDRPAFARALRTFAVRTRRFGMTDAQVKAS